MALIRAKAKDAFDYVVNVVFQVPKDGSLYKALEKSGDNDVMAMISLRGCDIDTLTFDRSDTEKNIPLTRNDKNLLCIFQGYLLHRHSIGNPIGQDFWSISAEDFEDYRLGHYLTTLADSEAPSPASTAQNSLQLRPSSQFSIVDQALAQDFVEDLDPGYTDAVETIPSANEGISRFSPDHVFAISEDHPCIEPPGGEIPTSSPDSIPQDLSAPLLTSIFQEFSDTSNAVLKSTEFQVHDFPTMAQAISSHLLPLAISLQADSAVQKKTGSGVFG